MKPKAVGEKRTYVFFFVLFWSLKTLSRPCARPLVCFLCQTDGDIYGMKSKTKTKPAGSKIALSLIFFLEYSN